MAKNLANIRIYGDNESAAYVGPKGTTLPTDLVTALNAAFKDLGWLSTDGVEQAREVSSADFNAWQGGAVVRSKITGVKDTLKVVCLEETAVTLGLYYAGATITTATGVSTVVVPGGASTDERALVVDFFDGDVQKRITAARAAVTSIGTVSHKNEDMTMYELTFTLYGGFSIITDNPAVATA